MYNYIHYAEFCFLGAGVLSLLLHVYLQALHMRECPRIHADVHLREFKAFVRLQWLLSGIFVVSIIPAVALVFLEKPGLPLSHKLGLLLPYLVMGVIIIWVRRGLHRIRDVSRCDPAYVEQFLRACGEARRQA